MRCERIYQFDIGKEFTNKPKFTLREHVCASTSQCGSGQIKF